MRVELHAEYSREQIHDIFDPESPFVKGAGTWGQAGIIRIPDRPGDFVFIVAYGKTQGDHTFDEGISKDGVIRWQSQPSQTLNDSRIRSFVSHDEQTNTIYLFLRTRLGAPYTYLGRLKYLEHERDQERPVHFIWQLLDWPIPDDVLSQMGLVLEDGGEAYASECALEVADIDTLSSRQSHLTN